MVQVGPGVERRPRLEVDRAAVDGHRGLAEDLVVAPYATALAAMVDPHAAALNFATLRGIQALGDYGFYEALD